jgi:hypothetical protein
VVGAGRPQPSTRSQPRSLREQIYARRAQPGREILVNDQHRRQRAQSHQWMHHQPKRIAYHDRPHGIYPTNRHNHVYYDGYNRRCHQMIWPRYHYPVYYRYGHHHAARYVHPFYHRKNVFVSVGGYWPADCHQMRYSWYGWHPYAWYGYSPIPRTIGGDSNYYTYNYYGNEGGGALAPVDHTTFSDVREKMAQQPTEPDKQGPADAYFDRGVKAFEQGNYLEAGEEFRIATALDQTDIVLPFAYAQSLFAGGHYAGAADVLRLALERIDTRNTTIFYPRGLYKDEDALFKQIDALVEKAEKALDDTDLQLLMGYHLLGIGEVQSALAPLERASFDEKNRKATSVLIDLLAKVVEQQQAEAEAVEAQTQTKKAG